MFNIIFFLFLFFVFQVSILIFFCVWRRRKIQKKKSASQGLAQATKEGIIKYSFAKIINIFLFFTTRLTFLSAYKQHVCLYVHMYQQTYYPPLQFFVCSLLFYVLSWTLYGWFIHGAMNLIHLILRMFQSLNFYLSYECDVY